MRVGAKGWVGGEGVLSNLLVLSFLFGIGNCCVILLSDLLLGWALICSC